MGGQLALELDVEPVWSPQGGPADFAARNLTAFFSRPLVALGSSAGALSSLSSEEDGRCWTGELAPDLVWESGVPVDASELAASLAWPALGWAADLLHRATGAGNHIRLELTRPVSLLPAMLTCWAFSPKSDRYGRLMGAYGDPVRHDRLIGLRCTPWGRQTWPGAPDNVRFVVTDSTEQGLRLFERGLIDVTCNPNLPHDVVLPASIDGLRRRQDLLMCGVLVFLSAAWRAAPATARRKAISSGLDRSALAASLDLRPVEDFRRLWQVDVRIEAEPGENHTETAAPGPVELTIGYADFAPNGSVVAAVAKAASVQLGITVRTLAMDYATYIRNLQHPEVDAIYTLVQPPYDHPSAILEAARRARWLQPEQVPAFQACLEGAEASMDQAEQARLLDRCFDMLATAALVVPIVGGVSRCLVSERASQLELGHDGVFRPPSIRELQA